VEIPPKKSQIPGKTRAEAVYAKSSSDSLSILIRSDSFGTLSDTIIAAGPSQKAHNQL
jgi:hypothetical protein